MATNADQYEVTSNRYFRWPTEVRSNTYFRGVGAHRYSRLVGGQREALHLRVGTQVEALAVRGENQRTDPAHVLLPQTRRLHLQLEPRDRIHRQLALVAKRRQAVIDHARLVVLARDVDQADLAHARAIDGRELLLGPGLQVWESERLELLLRANHQRVLAAHVRTCAWGRDTSVGPTWRAYCTHTYCSSLQHRSTAKRQSTS